MRMKLTAHISALVVKKMFDFFKMQTHPGKNYKKKTIQVGHSVGHLYVGSLGGVIVVGGDPPSPYRSGGGGN